MVSGSNVLQIVDYTAALAATIQGLSGPGRTLGVTAVYGSGQGTTNDPLRPGYKVQSAPSAERPGELAHLSLLPDAPGITPSDQDGAVDLTWRLPMQLVLPRTSLAQARAIALPFYDGYIAAFWGDRTLGDLCSLAMISRFALTSDGQDKWLAVDLTVLEAEVAYS